MVSLHSVIEAIDNVRFIRVFPYMSLMVYCASLFVCESVRKSQRVKNMTWIESLFVCFIGQFGGTTIASLMIGQPIRFLTSDKLVVALLAAWATIFCAPFDLGLKALQVPIIRVAMFFLSTAVRLPLVPASEHLVLRHVVWRGLRVQERSSEGQSG